MITQQHLEQWLEEINYQLTGILKEINAEKVQMKIINVGKTGESVVSFEYLQEKASTIYKLLKTIKYDIKND